MKDFNFVVVAKIAGGRLAVAELGSILSALRTGSIQEYDSNRGSVGPDPKRVVSIAEHFRAESLGNITLSEGNSSFTLADAHTRLRAALLAQDQDLLTSQDLRKLIPLTLIPASELKIAYHQLNNNAPHNTKHYVTNPDMPLGQLVNSVVSDQTIINKFYQQLAGISVMLQEDYKEKGVSDWNDCMFNYPILALSSARVKEINKSELNYNVKLDVVKKRWFREALSITVKMRERLEELVLEARESKTKHLGRKASLTKKLLNNNSFFGACLIGAIANPSKSRFIFGDLECPEEVAERIFKRIDAIMPDGKLGVGRHAYEGAHQLARITKSILK